LAFAWRERIDSVTVGCELGDTFFINGQPTWIARCFEERVLYTTAPSRIVTVRPDGSGREVVADGRDPAWAPDGSLYFSAADDFGPISRIGAGGGEPIPLAGTEGGREPAISPDGNWLAFSRAPTRAGARDIYIVRLQ